MNALRPLATFVAVTLMLSGQIRAQLSASSPFLPAAGAVSSAPTEGASLELRGIMAFGAGMRFCIYDTVRKTSAWVGLNESGYEYVVKTQDLSRDTVTVDQGGRQLTLALRDTKVASSGQAAAPMSMPGIIGPNPITQPVVLNPTPADEQQRLDAVQTEVRRRRALREQASVQAGSQPPQPLIQPTAEAQAQQRTQRTQGQSQNQNRTRPRN